MVRHAGRVVQAGDVLHPHPATTYAAQISKPLEWRFVEAVHVCRDGRAGLVIAELGGDVFEVRASVFGLTVRFESPATEAVP